MEKRKAKKLGRSESWVQPFAHWARRGLGALSKGHWSSRPTTARDTSEKAVPGESAMRVNQAAAVSVNRGGCRRRAHTSQPPPQSRGGTGPRGTQGGDEPALQPTPRPRRCSLRKLGVRKLRTLRELRCTAKAWLPRPSLWHLPRPRRALGSLVWDVWFSSVNSHL